MFTLASLGRVFAWAEGRLIGTTVFCCSFVGRSWPLTRCYCRDLSRRHPNNGARAPYVISVHSFIFVHRQGGILFGSHLLVTGVKTVLQFPAQAMASRLFPAALTSPARTASGGPVESRGRGNASFLSLGRRSLLVLLLPFLLLVPGFIRLSEVLLALDGHRLAQPFPVLILLALDFRGSSRAAQRVEPVTGWQ